MNDSDFDRMLRQRHAEAVTQVSAPTRAQLHRRLAAAASSPRDRVHRAAWVAAAACAAVLVLVIGVQQRPQPGSPAVPASTAIDSRANDAALDATFDETPDFYVWLASSDAAFLASE